MTPIQTKRHFHTEMSGMDTWNLRKSFQSRSGYLENADDLILSSVKSQLDLGDSSDSYETSSEHSSESSALSERFNSSAYYYEQEDEDPSVTRGHQHGAVNEILDKTNSNTELSKGPVSFELKDSIENSFRSADHPQKSRSHNLGDLRNGNNGPSASGQGKTVSNNPLVNRFTSDSNLEPDGTYLNRVFSDLEKNLSDVRIQYQTSLSTSSLQSAVIKQDYRLSHAVSSHQTSNAGRRPQTKSKDFDLNKWFDELPAGLRNFVEVETLSHQPSVENVLHDDDKPMPASDTQETKMGSLFNRNLYFAEVEKTVAQPISREESLNQSLPTDDGRYIDLIKKDYLDPIREMVNDDIDYIKGGLTNLYNQSPQVLQSFMNNSMFDFGLTKPDFNDQKSGPSPVDPGSYYLQSNRDTNGSNSPNVNNEARNNADTASSKDHKDGLVSVNCKVYNIYDKYECFDLRENPGLTHVSSMEITSPNKLITQGDEPDPDEEEPKLVKSIGDYNIGFLCNLSRVNEKCQLLNSQRIRCKLMKPWFLDPINEKIHTHQASDSARPKSDRYFRDCGTETREIQNKNNTDGVKYILTRKDEDVKYLIKSSEEADPDRAENGRPNKINLYEIENYYRGVGGEWDDDDRNSFYDPITDFEIYKEKQKKTMKNTDWATFGRPCARRSG